jgi:hypothetical protein
MLTLCNWLSLIVQSNAKPKSFIIFVVGTQFNVNKIWFFLLVENFICKIKSIIFWNYKMNSIVITRIQAQNTKWEMQTLTSNYALFSIILHSLVKVQTLASNYGLLSMVLLSLLRNMGLFKIRFKKMRFYYS